MFFFPCRKRFLTTFTYALWLRLSYKNIKYIYIFIYILCFSSARGRSAQHVCITRSHKWWLTHGYGALQCLFRQSKLFQHVFFPSFIYLALNLILPRQIFSSVRLPAIQPHGCIASFCCSFLPRVRIITLPTRWVLIECNFRIRSCVKLPFSLHRPRDVNELISYKYGSFRPVKFTNYV